MRAIPEFPQHGFSGPVVPTGQDYRIDAAVLRSTTLPVGQQTRSAPNLPLERTASARVSPAASIPSSPSRMRSIGEFPVQPRASNASYASIATAATVRRFSGTHGLFSRQRSGSIPNPITVVRDPREPRAYNITLDSNLETLDGELQSAALSSADRQQTFPETPNAFSPLFSGVSSPDSSSPGSGNISSGTPVFIVVPGVTGAGGRLALPITPQTSSSSSPPTTATTSASGSSSLNGYVSPNGVHHDLARNEILARAATSALEHRPSSARHHTARTFGSQSSLMLPGPAISEIAEPTEQGRAHEDAALLDEYRMKPLPPRPSETPLRISLSPGEILEVVEPPSADSPGPASSTTGLESAVAAPPRSSPPPTRMSPLPSPAMTTPSTASDIPTSASPVVQPSDRSTEFSLESPPPFMQAPPPYEQAVQTQSSTDAHDANVVNFQRPRGDSGAQAPGSNLASIPEAASRSMFRQTGSPGRVRTRPPIPLGPRQPSQFGNFSPGPLWQEPNAALPTVDGGTVLGAAGGSISGRHRLQSIPTSSPRFQTPPLKWRGLTMEAAKWTLTSAQLQDIVSSAIKKSAEASFIRLLPPGLLDADIPVELQRLQTSCTDIKAKYKLGVRRRWALMSALIAQLDGANSFDGTNILQLLDDLVEVSSDLDSLAENLHSTGTQFTQVQSLRDVHSASALAMALRKLNNSFVKQAAEVQHLRQKVESLEAERDEAWKQAEDVALEFDGLNDRLLDTGLDSASREAFKPTSRRSSIVTAHRKSSALASKAGLRRSTSRKSARSSSSTNLSRSNSLATPSATKTIIPPVPPIPSIEIMTPHVTGALTPRVALSIIG
jgi:hypothetical protein